jgi:predicted TIM-barrel fold metal-dependent hydrolase
VIVDFHVHVFPPNVQQDRTPYLERDPIFRSIYTQPRARIATIEDLIESMDRDGVDVSVIQGFAWVSQELCVEHNDYLLECAARYPGRIIPFCTWAPGGTPGAAGETPAIPGAAVLHPSARGIGELRPDEQGVSDWAALDSLWAVARERGLVLLVHSTEPVGHFYHGKGGMTPDRLYGLLQRFPEWPVVLAHLGGGLPFYATMAEVRMALGNAYVDTAAWPLLYGPEVFPLMVSLIGADRVLFASDFPLREQRAEVERMSRVGLGPDELTAILGGNAVRLLGLGA